MIIIMTVWSVDNGHTVSLCSRPSDFLEQIVILLLAHWNVN